MGGSFSATGQRTHFPSSIRFCRGSRYRDDDDDDDVDDDDDDTVSSFSL